MNDQTRGVTDLKEIAHQAMLDRGLEPDFPSDVLLQLGSISVASRETAATVRDLRGLLWCSIDNDDSMDLDQLTVAEKLSNDCVKVFVAIADVDGIVKTGSAVDLHARKNTTSVYTAAKIFPMLPEKLSTDLTSLSPGEERMAVIVEMTVDGTGVVQASRVYRGLVKNHAKLAYRGVAAWLEGKGPAPARVSTTSGLDEQLRMQDQVAQKMKLLRQEHGALDLQTIEPRAVVESGFVVDLQVEKKNRARELIEDFMIGANSVTARFLRERGFPSLRRVVRTPERWDRIMKIAEGMGDQLPLNPDSQALSAFLVRRRQADPLRFPDLSLTIVKLLGSGEYTLESAGQGSTEHFGLAVRDYSHSTAPNRRYPDLITQRLLKAAIDGNVVPYTDPELDALANHCTTQENAAGKVERQVRKSAAAQFLSRRVGERFDAIVTGVTEAGIWLRVLQPPIEGKLVDSHAGIDVGDRIRVELVRADVRQGFIDFVLTH